MEFSPTIDHVYGIINTRSGGPSTRNRPQNDMEMVYVSEEGKMSSHFSQENLCSILKDVEMYII